ncbi:uncharacterized protein IL334_003970 [Kwoniella shivajii]|uniref:PIG-P domain-containing protein n=1 Tax=Kwoniella shivajii TaxID=564305 RepID=A0ABZ1D0E0_9TREE|nr:hypothetical protein IL334_003970 [Kwoniella shivajii]
MTSPTYHLSEIVETLQDAIQGDDNPSSNSQERRRGEKKFSPPPHGPFTSLTLYLFSSLMFVISISSFLLGISYIYCPSEIIPFIKPICQDEHYKYIIPLLIPVIAWFSIANWVGWEYFRYS